MKKPLINSPEFIDSLLRFLEVKLNKQLPHRAPEMRMLRLAQDIIDIEMDHISVNDINNI